jgi:hypothetical protein
MSQCQKELQAAGKAYPRTCQLCGLFGPCHKGLPNGMAPNMPATDEELVESSQLPGQFKCAHCKVTSKGGLDHKSSCPLHHSNAIGKVPEKPQGCSCHFPTVLLQNGSGHDPSCPIHQAWIEAEMRKDLEAGGSQFAKERLWHFFGHRWTPVPGTNGADVICSACGLTVPYQINAPCPTRLAIASQAIESSLLLSTTYLATLDEVPDDLATRLLQLTNVVTQLFPKMTIQRKA